MKNILILLICFVLNACSTPKKTESVRHIVQSEHRKNDIVETRSDSIHVEKNRHEEYNNNTRLETETTTVVYDTDKPVNPDTGKHPVKSETTVKTSAKSDSNTKSDNNIVINNNAKSLKSDNSEKDLDNEITVIGKSDPEDPFQWRYIFGILLILSIIAFKLYKKFKKP